MTFSPAFFPHIPLPAACFCAFHPSIACLARICYTKRRWALGESDPAELAEQQLRKYTEAAVRILGLIPLVVVQSLREDGAPVREETVLSVARTVAEIWRRQVEPLASM